MCLYDGQIYVQIPELEHETRKNMKLQQHYKAISTKTTADEPNHKQLFWTS